ncbi:MAG: hypothetical protein JSW65_02515 [Candidatus Bipolaricaulota bacterium]|nr:MAG: hypothetical protein JSW65_02515 [Candidatus Bipolaricaulota bacterium]
MRLFSFVAVSTINLLIGIRYCWQIRRRAIHPSLAMWVFFTIAAVGSLLTYLGDGQYGLLDNILNTADIVLVGGVALFIAVFGERSSRFTRFDLGCLIAVVVIMIGWAMTRHHVAAHALIQAVMLIAYLPVVRRIWTADRNTESFTMWVGLMLAPIVSLLSGKGTLAWVYAIRASACPAALLLLMVRAELRSRRAGRSLPAEGGET